MRLLPVSLLVAAAVLSGCGKEVRASAESMEPTILRGESVDVDEVDGTYRPRLGDIVLYEDPGGWLGPGSSGGKLLHRVLGTPGDVLVCCDSQGRLSVNGEALDEDYLGPDPGPCNAVILAEWALREGTDLAGPCDWTLVVPDRKVFVLGDNRGHTADSRVHLCAPEEDPCAEEPWVDVRLVRGTAEGK